MLIKIYEDKYRQQVIDLVLNIQQNEFNVPVSLENQPDLGDIPNVCQVGNGNFWVAIINDEVVGTIALLDNGMGIGTLRKMFVKANYRGAEHSIAQKLLDNLWLWAKSHAYKIIYLGTIERLIAARKFYERNAFSAINKSDLPAGVPIMAVDTHFYYKELA